MGSPSEFDFLIGTWDVHNRRLESSLVGSDTWREFSARVVGFTKLLNGSAHLDQFIVGSGDDYFEGVSLRVFDVERDQWTIYWMDTSNPVPTKQVVGSFTQGVGEFFGEESYQGRPVSLRFRWSDITPDAARWEQAYLDDKRELWETNWVMEFTRTG